MVVAPHYSVCAEPRPEAQFDEKVTYVVQVLSFVIGIPMLECLHVLYCQQSHATTLKRFAPFKRFVVLCLYIGSIVFLKSFLSCA